MRAARRQDVRALPTGQRRQLVQRGLRVGPAAVRGARGPGLLAGRAPPQAGGPARTTRQKHNHTRVCAFSLFSLASPDVPAHPWGCSVRACVRRTKRNRERAPPSPSDGPCWPTVCMPAQAGPVARPRVQDDQHDGVPAAVGQYLSMKVAFKGRRNHAKLCETMAGCGWVSCKTSPASPHVPRAHMGVWHVLRSERDGVVTTRRPC